MAALDDLLVAFDSYMKTNAKPGSTGGKYLATKLAAIFEDPSSPFSTKKGGVIDILSKKVSRLSDKIGKIANDKGLSELAKNITSLNATVYKLNTTQKSTSAVKIDPIKSQALLLNNLFKGLRSNLYLTSGIKVEVVSINKNLLGQIGKIVEKAVVASQDDYADSASSIKQSNIYIKLSNLLSSNKNDKVSNNKHIRPYGATTLSQKYKEVTGTIGTIWSWIKGIGLIITGIFALSKIKQYLDHSEFGKQLYARIDSIWNTLTDNIITTISKMKIGDRIIDGLKTIAGFVGDIFKGIYQFYQKHKDGINNQLQSAWDGVWNNILTPLYHAIKKVDYGKLLSDVSGFLWNKVLHPIIASIGESFSKGDYKGAILKTALASIPVILAGIVGTSVLKLIPGFGSLLKVVTGLSSNILGLIPKFLSLGNGATGLAPKMLKMGEGLGSLVNPVTLVSIAAAAAVGALLIATNNLNEQVKKSEEIDAKSTKTSNKKITNLLNQIKTLEKIPETNRTPSQRNELAGLQLKVKKERVANRNQFEQSQVKEELGTFWGATSNYFTGALDDKQQEINDKFTAQNELIDTKQKSLNARKDREGIDNVKFAQRQKDTQSIIDTIRAGQKANTQSKTQFSPANPNPIKIQTAKPIPELTGATQLNGLTDSVDKLTLISVSINQALANLTDATVTGHNQVTKAVIATAPIPTPPPTPVGGGGDPIFDQRVRASEYFRK